VRLTALNLEEDLKVDLSGLGSESVIQRISGFSLKFTVSHFHLDVTFLCNYVESEPGLSPASGFERLLVPSRLAFL